MLKYRLLITTLFLLLLNLSYAVANNGKPDYGSDEYAEFVVSKGAQHKLTRSQMAAISSEISRSVVSSYGRIIDRHTAASIEYTLIDALFISPTFQSSVLFGIHNGQEHIGQIHFSNEYEINEEQNAFSDVDEVEAGDIEDSNAITSPLIASHEAREDDNGNPIVNIGVAPSIHSSEYPWWQEALIHEVIHHITGSSDPDSEVRHGPTEILAQRIANENNWVVPSFRGYGDAERVKGIKMRNFNSLIQAIERHPAEAVELMDRISAISAGLQASCHQGYSLECILGATPILTIGLPLSSSLAS